MRWNFSSRARELSGGDVIIISIPKSGRTWVRTFLSAYFTNKAGRQFSIDVTDKRTEGVPRIIYSHDRFEHRTKANAWGWLRGKYLIPARELRKARVILLARDPRDAFVSYFLQLTRRNPATPPAIRQMSADALLRHPRFGIEAMVDTMNSWLAEFGNRPHFAIVRYEDLRADAARELRALLGTITEGEIDSAAFASARQFSNFENMKQLEASGAFGTKILQARDRDDPESFKVRRGKIGGFADYLSPEGQRLAAIICEKLDHAFGYEISCAVGHEQNAAARPTH